MGSIGDLLDRVLDGIGKPLDASGTPPRVPSATIIQIAQRQAQEPNRDGH
jgi:hypothetical protein